MKWYEGDKAEQLREAEAGNGIPLADGTLAVDTTTYDNPVGAGKIVVVVAPDTGDDAVAFATAVEGDAFPRMLWFASPISGGIDIADGTTDPWNGNSAGFFARNNGDGTYYFGIVGGFNSGVAARFGVAVTNLGTVDQLKGPVQIVGAGGVDVAIQVGNGAPAVGGRVGDMYIRKDGGDGSWIYRCTVAGAAGAATWVAKLYA